MILFSISNSNTMKKNFVIIANAALGKGLSGSDRIFIELAKQLSDSVKVVVCVWEEGYEMCQRQKLVGVTYEKWYLGRFKNLPFIFNYFFRIFTGVYYALKFNANVKNSTDLYFYAASDFWQDFFPFLILKTRFPEATFIGTFYLGAPNPFIGFRKEYEKTIQLPKLKDIFYYLQQLVPKWLLPLISNFIFVTSEPDKKYFSSKGFNPEKIYPIMGGVNFENYAKLTNNIEKKYDAVFYGRFHPQKGVIEMIDIWKKLIKKLPEAKLVMIGNGPLYEVVKQRINFENLQDNIKLTGHLDDSLYKYQIFSQSKVVVHPAVYDSGGMAAAEIMYLKIPGVAFDLEALKTYYPIGMIKTKCFDLDEFSMNIYKLLTDKKLYSKLSSEAKECVLINFDWKKKVQFIKENIFEI